MGIFTIVMLTNCSGPAQRNKWQKKSDFSKRRGVYYNEFVSSGGMNKEEANDPSGAWKKEIQQAIQQGRVNQ